MRKLRKIRRDGIIIDETLTLTEQLTRGIPPCKVDALDWECDGRKVAYRVPFGLLAMIIPGRQFLAVIEDKDDTGSPRAPRHCREHKPRST
jgi:hypothetical protein